MARFHITPPGIDNRQFTQEEEEVHDAMEAAHIAGASARSAMRKIKELETLPRRTRERLAALGDQYSIDEESKIATERGKL